MGVVSYNKLVRDNVPDIIRKNGEDPVARVLGEDEYKNELKKKLLEEAAEVFGALEENDLKEITKEIGDVQEVLDSITSAFDLDMKEVARVRMERLKKRGGFKGRVYLESVESPDEEV